MTSGSADSVEPATERSTAESREQATMSTVDRPLTRATIAEALRYGGIETGSLLVVHSSLSRLGWVVGGPQSVVEALLDVVGPEGTIVMPSMSAQLTDPAIWSNPPVPPEWLDEIRANMPVFDPAITPTRAMGQIVDCFRGLPGAVRSAHSTSSFVAHGPLARDVCGVHPMTPQFGEDSPLGALYRLDATVLLLGVTHGNNTSLHLAEHRAEWPSKKWRDDSARLMIDGEPTWVAFTELEPDEGDFAELGDAFAAAGHERQVDVGAGVARIFSQRAVVDFGVEWISAHRG